MESTTLSLLSMLERAGALAHWDVDLHRIIIDRNLGGAHGETLGAGITLDIEEKDLELHIHQVGMLGAEVYPDDPVLEAGLKLFATHIEETIVMRPQHTTKLELRDQVLRART